MNHNSVEQSDQCWQGIHIKNGGSNLRDQQKGMPRLVRVTIGRTLCNFLFRLLGLNSILYFRILMVKLI